MSVLCHPSAAFLPHETPRRVSQTRIRLTRCQRISEREKRPNRVVTRSASRNFSGERTFFGRFEEKNESVCGEKFSAFSRKIFFSLEKNPHICGNYAKIRRIFRINMQENAPDATASPFSICQTKRKRCLFVPKSSHTATKRHLIRQKDERAKRQDGFSGGIRSFALGCDMPPQPPALRVRSAGADRLNSANNGTRPAESRPPF